MAIEIGRRLDSKVCLVTGGGSGIGRATALAFAGEGARVVVADINLAGAEETAQQAVGEALALRLDVTQPAEVEAAVATVVARYGRLDVLACIAGVMLPEDGLVHETDPSVWDRTFAVNLRGTFLCCKYAVLQMRRQGGGVIVNTASTSSTMPGVCPTYDASKAAVLQLSRVIAVQYAAENIRCNAVAPGGTATPLVTHPNFRRTSERFGSVAPMLQPAFSQPEQIATAFVFLASDDSSYITGACFPVDAGMTAR